MLKKIIIPLIIFACAILFFKFMLSSKDKTADISVDEHIWRVDQVQVNKQLLSPSLTLYGRVESSELLNAAAPAASQVAKVLVKEGEYIKKGQLMLSLDKADFEPIVQSAQAKVMELNALIKSDRLRHEIDSSLLKNEQRLLTLSKKALARSEKVKRQKLGSISETEQAMMQVEMQQLSYNKMKFSVREYEARKEQLEARLMQAQADLAKTELALQRSQIIAPFSGVVAGVNVAQGDRVNINEKLLSFYSTEHLEIRAKIPVNNLFEVQQSLNNKQALTGIASNGSQQVPLRLERISGQAQASGIDAIFAITIDQVHFRIGTIVVLRLQRAARENMITVPYQAMYGSERLYQIKDNRLKLVKVKTIGEHYNSKAMGQSDTQDVQLLIASDSLQTGDMILVTHLPNAFTGLKVEVVSKKEHIKAIVK